MARHKSTCILVPKWTWLKKVQGRPQLEKCYPQYQCPLLISTAFALLGAQITSAVPWMREACGAFGREARETRAEHLPRLTLGILA